jgi:hypothetical protein
MNPELHHKWNAERTPTRESDKEGPQILKENLEKSKVLLKQNRPK